MIIETMTKNGGIKMIKKCCLLTTIVLLTIILMVGNIIVLAQEEQEESNTVYINAEHLEYEDEKTILSGKINIKKNETVIQAARGELFREENRMELEEEINVDYPDGNVKAKRMSALLDAEEYVFENSVVLKYLLEEEENDMVLNSDYLKIFGDNNSFNAKNNVVIDYDNKIFKGDNADYNGDEEILYLTGNVLIEEGEDWVKSDEAKFFLGSDEKGYTADGNVEIKINLD